MLATVDVGTAVVAEVFCAAVAICTADCISGGGGASSRIKNHQIARMEPAVKVRIARINFRVLFQLDLLLITS